MIQSGLRQLLRVFGPDTLMAYARWAPSNADTQTVAESQGVASITRNGAGDYTVNLTRKSGALFALVAYVDDGTTEYNFVDVSATSAANKTVSIRHRSVAFASVKSGPSGSDSVDEIQVMVFEMPQTGCKQGSLLKPLKTFGPRIRFAYARWVPSTAATQTLSEAQGVKSITQSSTGLYQVNLQHGSKALLAFPQYVENDATHYHFVNVTSTNAAAGTVSLRHRSTIYGSVTSAPTLNDTVDQLEVLILQRMS